MKITTKKRNYYINKYFIAITKNKCKKCKIVLTNKQKYYLTKINKIIKFLSDCKFKMLLNKDNYYFKLIKLKINNKILEIIFKNIYKHNFYIFEKYNFYLIYCKKFILITKKIIL